MSLIAGSIACATSALFFGSMFVPLRGADVGDGLFVQWLMATAILVIGFIVHAIQGFPGFYPLAMLGGVFWTLGNVTAIPIIARLGMAQAILIWNTTNCLSGWASGNFGLFGMKARPATNSILNLIGLGFVVLGLKERQEPSEDCDDSERMTLKEDVLPEKPQPPFGGRMLGFGLALAAGVFYGITFAPVIYLQDNADTSPLCNKTGCPPGGLPYVFSHYSGVFLTATFLFALYAIIMKGRPHVEGDLVLRGWGAGILWAIAQSSFFVANEILSQTVTFPIITMLPGCVAAIWSIVVFKEIRGRRNFLFMAAATAVTLTGSLCVALSK